jgi:hypothetical protein
LRLPSFSQINEKLSVFEKQITAKIEEFKEDHSLLDRAVQELLPLLPQPFDAIASRIYNRFDGSNEEKTNAVLRYFKNLQIQGEDHHNKIAAKLDSILVEMDDVKQKYNKFLDPKKEPENIMGLKITLVCSLLSIAEILITKDLLRKMKLENSVDYLVRCFILTKHPDESYTENQACSMGHAICQTLLYPILTWSYM